MTSTADSGPVFRAGPENERATAVSEHVTTSSECAHSVITDEKSPVFARDSGMLADSQSVDSRRAVVRQPMGKVEAATSYKRALGYLVTRYPLRVHGIQQYVRCTRAEAAAWRVKAQMARREIKLLKIQLNEAYKGSHE